MPLKAFIVARGYRLSAGGGEICTVSSVDLFIALALVRGPTNCRALLFLLDLVMVLILLYVFLVVDLVVVVK